VRRRRRSLTGRVVKTSVAVVVLLAFLVVGDRWAALYAENQAAGKVKSALKLHAEPEVHIGGFPFLTQLAGKRLDKVDIAIPDMQAGRVSVAQVKGSVSDVRIVGSAPSSIKGAVLGRMRGDVLLDFDDLDRELGTSQVAFTSGGGNTVRADGKLPVAGKEVKVRARAHLRRTGDHGVGTTVDEMRLEVPGLFSYTPGKDGGLRLARPLAQRVQRDAAEAKALFRVGSVAKRFGLTAERARVVRHSERELQRVTGQPAFVDKLMKVNMLDVLIEHPWLLKKIGIDPGLVAGLKKIEEPKLAEKLSLSQRLPDVPGDVRLRGISVAKDGIRAQLTGVDVPLGGAPRR
ncbi:MAG: LmeA family phospholipid-binding protein, partial [Nocardioidaceae bacterium]